MADAAEIQDVLARLASAPARFAAALSRVDDADSLGMVSGDEWAPEQVLAHVRASSDIIEPRLLQILVRDDPPLIAFDDARWAEVAHYTTLPVTESLETMRLRRKELVRALRAISPEDWERGGSHEVRGRLTLLELARQIADHEDEHVAQIESSVEVTGGR
jgi:hypothetical protein